MSDHNDSDDGGWTRWRSIAEESYTRFLDQLRANRPLFPGLSPYDASRRAEAAHGSFIWGWGVPAEISETINTANAWGMRLHEWGTWNMVIDTYDDEDVKWEVLYHFVEPLASFCMHQPTSLTDRIALSAENALHQANLQIFDDHRDRLDQDNLKPGKFLGRKARRAQLIRMGQRWPRFSAFLKAFDALDDDEYQKTTRNYRDLAAHSFAPRFMMGHVSRAFRSAYSGQEPATQEPGTSPANSFPQKRGVTYAMGNLEPLSLSAMHEANLAEYQKTRTAIAAFATLIEELCDRMDALPKPQKQ